jgi:hypothetical protein
MKSIVSVLALGLVMTLGTCFVAGCGSGTSADNKMSGDKMGMEDKMMDDKMEGDKMDDGKMK